MVTLYEEVRAALRNSDFRPKKKLGQNFLVHKNVIESILRLLQLSPGDEIVEIGPGLGFLTRRLVEVASKVWAIEIDDFLADWLRRSSLASNPAFELIHADILKVALENILPPYKIKLAANLPYSISTPALFRLFGWRNHFAFLVLMVQKELADRIVSGPGTKTYGSLSVWCQIHGRVVEKVSVSPEAFFPRPAVRSMILKIELYPEPRVPPAELADFRALVRSAFGQRRKTLSNALSSSLKHDRDTIEGILRSEGIDPKRRGETLSLEEFISLSRSLKQLSIPSLETA